MFFLRGGSTNSSNSELLVSMTKKTRKSKFAGTNTDVMSAPAQTAPAVSMLPAPKPASAPQPPASAKPQARGGSHVCLEFAKPDAKSVCVAGSFNGWKPEKTPLVRTGNGNWVGDLTVNPGRHEYLFVVDGQWVPDPKARESVQNPFGGRNSVLVVAG